MSYIALARKYRPKNFQDFVGQQHVVRALSNAIAKQRLHHAYLLTGTRGVGKTTLGRIIAKCLNCHSGITATPCGECPSCVEITAGQAFDLIEIDAASNTKVEDTRTILDNVQYAPNRDRFKIYLIDEVHMLSNHSFNALLKTLEEPPEHVKFILATTDPQKLPITVLSRCLQFNLKNMPADVIAAHLTDVCQQEIIGADANALLLLGQAAKGSMRDGLSLLDQAIAYSDGKVDSEQVQAMLGNVADEQLYILLQALANNDAQGIYEQVNQLASLGTDFQQALLGLLSLLHQISLCQMLPKNPIKNINNQDLITDFAKQFSKNDIQLYYQIALVGRRDLDLAPSPRMGFEMLLLRMLQFVKSEPRELPDTAPATSATTKPTTVANATPAPKLERVVNEPKTPYSATPESSPAVDLQDWHSISQQLALTGIAAAFIKHCALEALTDEQITLQIDPKHAAMVNDKQKKRIESALNDHFGKPIGLVINVCIPTSESPIVQQQRQQAEGKQAVKQSLENDPKVQNILNQFDATIDEASINLQEEKP